MELDSKEEAHGLPVTSSLVYEEIGDVKSSFSYSKNVLYGLSTTKVTTRLISDPIPEVPTGATSKLTSDPTGVASKITSDPVPEVPTCRCRITRSRGSTNSQLRADPNRRVPQRG